MSTLTTILAFICVYCLALSRVAGVNSSFKGIRTFCLSSAIVMTSVFVTAFTLFIAVLTLSMRAYVRPLSASDA